MESDGCHICPCHGDSPHSGKRDLCPICVGKALQNLRQLREAALELRNSTREECSQCLEQTTLRLPELAHERNLLRERLDKMNQECVSLAVKVARQQLLIEERRAQKQDRNFLREKDLLERLNRSLFSPEEGAMHRERISSMNSIRRIRFAWALQAFKMFPVDVSPETKRPTQRQVHVRGIGKIGGLPLPHAPELYGPLPRRELHSALRLVASLTLTLARCLNVALPHPILLEPNCSQEYLVESVSLVDNSGEKFQHDILFKDNSVDPINRMGLNTTLSVRSLFDSESWGPMKSIFQRTTQPATITESTVIPKDKDCTDISERLLYAKTAVLAETPSLKEKFPLQKEQDENFSNGLQLLQNDVVVLCNQVEVPVSELWPAGSLLLNLHALFRHCLCQVLQSDE
jgi:hypothetical protein